MTSEQKLEQWAEREFRRHISNIIVDDPDHGLIVFGRYHLQPTQWHCTVCTSDESKLYFSNKRTALSWCVADKYHQYALANSIQTLDQKRQLLLADIDCRQRQVGNTKNSSFVDTVAAKLGVKTAKLQAINTELEKCIKTAKYFQIRGFSNETARTRVS
jgi:hypothetical protein